MLVDALLVVWVKKSELTIMAHMKQGNMRPKDGSSVKGGFVRKRGDLRDADKKKIVRRID